MSLKLYIAYVSTIGYFSATAGLLDLHYDCTYEKPCRQQAYAYNYAVNMRTVDMIGLIVQNKITSVYLLYLVYENNENVSKLFIGADFAGSEGLPQYFGQYFGHGAHPATTPQYFACKTPMISAKCVSLRNINELCHRHPCLLYTSPSPRD